MDTSETYIKRCEKATEIQLQWSLMYRKLGDYWWAEVESPTNARSINAILTEYPYITKNVWLPRQDQLQEMVPTKIAGTKPNLKMISEFTHFFDYWDTVGIPVILTTWEQLWLAFVMKEKYNKAWNGEDWIVDVLKR